MLSYLFYGMLKVHIHCGGMRNMHSAFLFDFSIYFTERSHIFERMDRY